MQIQAQLDYARARPGTRYYLVVSPRTKEVTGTLIQQVRDLVVAFLSSILRPESILNSLAVRKFNTTVRFVVIFA